MARLIKLTDLTSGETWLNVDRITMVQPRGRDDKGSTIYLEAGANGDRQWIDVAETPERIAIETHRPLVVEGSIGMVET